MKTRTGKAGLLHPKKQHKPKIRTLEFCIISAQDLKNVRKFGKMRTYAVAYVNPMHKVCTGIDREGGTNPTWDEKLKLEVEEDLLLDDESYTQLTIDIFNHGPLREKLVGSVRILLCDAVKENLRSLNRFPVASYLVFRPNGDPQGILNVCIPPGGRFPDSLDCISFKNDGDNSARFPCLSKQSSLCMTEVTTESSELTELESSEDAEEGVSSTSTFF